MLPETSTLDSCRTKKSNVSNESTFAIVRGVPKMMRRPSSVPLYNPKFTVKTMKELGSVMVWGGFSRNPGRAGLYFHIKNASMKGSICINVLKEHLCTFWRIHQCDHFIPDSAPAYDSKIVTKFLSNRNIPVLDSLVNYQI